IDDGFIGQQNPLNRLDSLRRVDLTDTNAPAAQRMAGARSVPWRVNRHRSAADQAPGPASGLSMSRSDPERFASQRRQSLGDLSERQVGPIIRFDALTRVPDHRRTSNLRYAHQERHAGKPA